MKLFLDWFYKRKHVKVGDRLGCATWGADYTEVKVVRLSFDGNKFLYEFVRIDGKDIEESDAYEGSIDFLDDIYVHIN